MLLLGKFSPKPRVANLEQISRSPDPTVQTSFRGTSQCEMSLSPHGTEKSRPQRKLSYLAFKSAVSQLLLWFCLGDTTHLEEDMTKGFHNLSSTERLEPPVLPFSASPFDFSGLSDDRAERSLRLQPLRRLDLRRGLDQDLHQ